VSPSRLSGWLVGLHFLIESPMWIYRGSPDAVLYCPAHEGGDFDATYITFRRSWY
jgi:hypothetical protein